MNKNQINSLFKSLSSESTLSQIKEAESILNQYSHLLTVREQSNYLTILSKFKIDTTKIDIAVPTQLLPQKKEKNIESNPEYSGIYAAQLTGFQYNPSTNTISAETAINLSIYNLSSFTLQISQSTGPIRLEHCNNFTATLKCDQLRLSSCNKCLLSVESSNPISTENCTEVLIQTKNSVIDFDNP